MPEPGLSGAERDFYQRQLVLPEVGETGQFQLKQAHVLVVGAGGLGCPALLHLAAAGVGRLRICEPDGLEIHNLHRQPLYGHAQIGQPKGRLARQRLTELNPHLRAEWTPRPFTPGHAAELLAEVDLVLDCADNHATSFALNAACQAARLPLVAAAVHGWDGQLLTVDPAAEAGCLRCLWPTQPAETEGCARRGILGTVPGLLGTLQAQEALKLLLGLPGDLRRELLLVDLLSFSTRRLRRHQHPDCPICGHVAHPEPLLPNANPELLEVDARDAELTEWRGRLLVDLREEGEPGRPLPAGHEILRAPLSGLRFPAHGLPTERELLVVCAHGVRSLWTVQRLRALGHARCWSLRGGMEGLGTGHTPPRP
ncbi:MAG: HesA/MoeB/ThiF family protein [Candidatus Delongbacteria bacterium]